MEISELSALKKSEVESIKAFISRQSDKYRPAYARFVSTFDRQCVFCGTTNEDSFLRDETGNRRFWCIEVRGGGKSVWEELPKEIPEIWAEAKSLYLLHRHDGGWFSGKGMERTVEERAQRFMETDPWESMIRTWLDAELPADWYRWTQQDRHDYFDPSASGIVHGLGVNDPRLKRTRVCAQEILNECLLKPKAQQTPQDVRRVNKIMSSIDQWAKLNPTTFPGYGMCRGFQRKAESTE